MGKNIFFNAHHSPMGAFSSFTLGFHGKGGSGEISGSKYYPRGVTSILWLDETRKTAPNEVETATV
ncbi:hypothetical protein [Fictibacillus enclensis]|uniref:hypothetical protein n=1 Tax=Fictibacillus enclensis TaxID=1017270 RepID=UPI0024C07B58|nr:hypothetical protein [Fictibacillus enclensis]WHY75108.1 hypothetical protein QNH15_03005 [Fictibacillus enclensis]